MSSRGSNNNGSSNKHDFESATKAFASSHIDQIPKSNYNFEMYARTAQFPGLQLSRLPVTNPSFEMARFLKSTGPGSSKGQDGTASDNKRARAKYKFMLQPVKKASKKLRSEEE